MPALYSHRVHHWHSGINYFCIQIVRQADRDAEARELASGYQRQGGAPRSRHRTSAVSLQSMCWQTCTRLICHPYWACIHILRF